VTLLDKVKNYANGARILYEWIGSGSQVVDQETAQKRATACLYGDTDKEGKPCACRHNQSGGIVAKAVAFAIYEQTQLKNELQLRVDGEKSLHQCSICSCQLKLKIWLPIETLRSEELPEEKGKWPAWCWMKNE